MNQLFTISGNSLHEGITALYKFFGAPIVINHISPFRNGKFYIYNHNSLPVLQKNNKNTKILISDPNIIINDIVDEYQDRTLTNNEQEWISFITTNVCPSVMLLCHSKLSYIRVLYNNINNKNEHFPFIDTHLYRYFLPFHMFIKYQFLSRRDLHINYSLPSDYPLAVISTQISNALPSLSLSNEIYIGGSKPCLIDILLYGCLTPLARIDQLNMLSNKKTLLWYSNMNKIYTLKTLDYEKKI